MRLEVGLLGATRIAERAVVGPAAARGDISVRAVAASDIDRAKDFASRNGIPDVHRNYAALVRDPAIDLVYVSLHNSAHQPWAVRAAEQGKHVLVEKPLCLDRRQLAVVAAAARTNRVGVFEAVSTAGHSWQREVREMLVSGRYGELRKVRADFRFLEPARGSYRLRRELGGGIFFDCASYWLQALQATTGLECVSLAGQSEFDGPGGVDRRFQAEVSWRSGTKSVLDCRIDSRHRAEIEFEFDDASARIRGLLRPTAGALPLNLVVHRRSENKTVKLFPPLAYYESQLTRVREFIEDREASEAELAAAERRIEVMADIFEMASRRRP